MVEAFENEQLSDRLRKLETEEPPVVCDSYTGAVSTPPLAAEINAAFGGTAAQLRDGWTGIIDDTVNGNTWLCVSENDNWRVFGIVGGGVLHNVLSATHPDTLPSAVSRGSLIYGNATPLWAELAHPINPNQLLTCDANDVLWSGWALIGTAGQTYTLPGASASIPGGTGVANQITYWSGINTVAGRASLTDDGTTVYINRNSATALHVEQNGVKDDTFIVDTTNALVGIGIVPTEELHVRKDQNDVTRILIDNDTSNTAARTQFRIDSGVVTGTMDAFSAGYTTAGSAIAASVRFFSSSNATNGLTFVTGTTAPIGLYINNALAAQLTSGADFVVGAVAASGQLHVDQSSGTGNQPVVYLDQAQLSYSYVYCYASSDSDMILLELSVTGGPKEGWDESEDAFTATHGLQINRSGALTNTIYYPFVLNHTTSGAAAALYGVGEKHALEDSAGNLQVASESATLWSDATSGSESPLYRITTYPQGTVGPGYSGFWTYRNINARVIVIPNGTGDVTVAATFMYVVSAITAGDSIAGTVSLGVSSSSVLYNDGAGDTFTITINADGSVDVDETGGDTFDVVLWGVWI